MAMSISLKKDTAKTNIKHNNRTMSEKEKERNSHIDFSKTGENKYLVQKDLRELYNDEFGKSQEKYNEKQKRSDRKIKNYYDHIQQGKKTSLQQEMILQIGDKDDFLNNDKNKKIANEVLGNWFNGFEKRNPNLKIYNAVIHNDETSPHLHLNFVPVATGYKRGMDKQVSFDKAIIQQDSTLDKIRPFEDWRNEEVRLLEQMLKVRGIERRLVGTNDYKDVNDMKSKKDELRELNKQISETKDELGGVNEKLQKKFDGLKLMESELDVLNTNFDEAKEILVNKRESLQKDVQELQEDVQGLLKAVEASKSIKSIKGEKGRLLERGIVKVGAEDFEDLKKWAMASEGFKVQNMKLQRNLDSTQEKNEVLRNKNVELRSENKELKTENTRLEGLNRSYQRTVAYLKDMIFLIKKNAEKFLNVTKEDMEGFVGQVRANSLLYEFKKAPPEKLMEYVPDEEKEGANMVFTSHQEKEQENRKENETERER
jgi:uncharacterized protein YoxC